MSKDAKDNRPQEQASEAQVSAQAATAVLDMPEPDPSLAIVKAEDDYSFENYHPATGSSPTDIRDQIRPGFDMRPYAPRWVLDKDTASLAARELTLVKRETHAKMFKDSAFDTTNGCICRGKLRDGWELYLAVRTKTAEIAEQRAIQDRTANLQKEQNKTLNQRIDNTKTELQGIDPTSYITNTSVAPSAAEGRWV